MSTLDLKAASQLLKVHPKTLQRLARIGVVPACKVGRAWVFVEALLLDQLTTRSLSRLCASDAMGCAKCRSTDAKTRLSGGSSLPPSGVSHDLYSRALGLPTSDRRGRSMTG